MGSLVLAALLAATRADAMGDIDYIVTTATDPATPGQLIVFDITVHNLTNSSQSVKLDWSVPQYTKDGCCFAAGEPRSHDFGTLTAGQSITYQWRVTVLNTASVPNGATINLVLNDLARSTSVSRSLQVRHSPVLGLNLSTEDATVAPGGNFTYTLAASNITNGSLAGAVLRLPVPAGATFVSADGGGTLGGGVVTWNLGTLGAGANEQVHVTFQAGSGNTPLGPIEATLTEGTGQMAAASDARMIVAAPVFQYVVTAVHDAVKPNQILEFDITVRNLTTSAQAVKLNWSVPQFTKDGCCFAAGEARSHDFGTLAAGQSITYQWRVDVVDTSLVADGATITLDLFDLARGISVSRSVVVRDVPALGLNLSTEQALVAPGSNFTYTLVASNLSGGNLDGAVLSAAIPSGATFVSADRGGTMSAGVVTWNFGALPPGANEQVHLTLQAGSGNTPLAPFNAVLTNNNRHIARASDVRAISAASPIFQYTVTAVHDAVKPSQILEFDITVRNLTTSSQALTLAWSVPQFTKDGCCFAAGEARSHDFGTLTAGQSITYQWRVDVENTNSVPDGATITLRLFDLIRGASISRSVVVRHLPALGLNLSTEQATVAPGSNFTYTIAASNISGGSVTGALLSATVPAGATFVSADSGGTLNGSVVTWNLGTLGAGANEQVRLTLQANAGSAPLGPFNAMLADAAGHIARASDVRVILAAPLFEYTVTAVQDPVQPGRTLEFNVRVRNLTTSSQAVTLNWSVPQFTKDGCCFAAGEARSHNFGTLTAGQAITYQWRVDVLGAAAVPEGGSITLNLFDLPRGAAVSRTVVIRSNIPPAPATPHYANISTRMSVGTGENVLIGGFIVTGAQSKRVLIRALGPSLPVAGALADPTLTLFDSAGRAVAMNDDWKDSPDKAAIISTTVPPSNDKESAMVVSVPPGTYTAVLAGAGNSTGVGLVEIYDLNVTANAELANISTRGLVRTGDDVMIGGIIIQSGAPNRIIVRAIGPSLPVNGALADPTLELRNGNGDLIFGNDNWRDSQEADIIASTVPPTNNASPPSWPRSILGITPLSFAARITPPASPWSKPTICSDRGAQRRKHVASRARLLYIVRNQ